MESSQASHQQVDGEVHEAVLESSCSHGAAEPTPRPLPSAAVSSAHIASRRNEHEARGDARRSGAEWFAAHEHLTGFSPDQLLFAVVKELFDNSRDACSRVVPPRPTTISVEVTNDAASGRVTVRVTDTGVSMTRETVVELLGGLFSSSAVPTAMSIAGSGKPSGSSRDVHRIGQAGIGAKLAMLHSHATTNEAATVIIAPEGEDDAHVMELFINAGDDVCTVEREWASIPRPEGLTSGTQIELQLSSPEGSVDKPVASPLVVSSLVQYFERFSLVPHGA